MPQNQCPWCGRLSARYEEGTPRDEQPQPHDDESACVCRHITTANRAAALRDYGRYWDDASTEMDLPVVRGSHRSDA